MLNSPGKTRAYCLHSQVTSVFNSMLYSMLGRKTERAPGSWGGGSARGGLKGGLFLGRSYGSLYSSPGKPRLWTEPFSEDGREEKSITVNSIPLNKLGTVSSPSFFFFYLLPIPSPLAPFLHDPESSAPLIDQRSPPSATRGTAQWNPLRAQVIKVRLRQRTAESRCARRSRCRTVRETGRGRGTQQQAPP